MAGRIRTVKPEWLEDELMAESSSDARVLSVGLILLADDHGNGRGSEKFLLSQVFPGKPLKVVRDALSRLVEIRFCVLYQADGQTYFHIRNWAKHQKISHPSKGKVPPPSGESPDILSRPSGDPPEDSGVSTDVVAPRAIPSTPFRSPPDLEGGPGGNLSGRSHGERPRPRPDLLHAHIEIADYRPTVALLAYAGELGLTPQEAERALEDLRDKHGQKRHTAPWLDDRLATFIETAAKSKREGRAARPGASRLGGAGQSNTGAVGPEDYR